MKVSVPIFTAVMATVAQGMYASSSLSTSCSESASVNLQAAAASYTTQSAAIAPQASSSECTTSTANGGSNSGNTPAAGYPPMSSAPMVVPASVASVYPGVPESPESTSTKTVHVQVVVTLTRSSGHHAPAQTSAAPVAPFQQSYPAGSGAGMGSGASYPSPAAAAAAQSSAAPAAASSGGNGGSGGGYPSSNNNVTVAGLPNPPPQITNGYTSGASSQVVGAVSAMAMVMGGLVGVMISSL